MNTSSGPIQRLDRISGFEPLIEPCRDLVHLPGLRGMSFRSGTQVRYEAGGVGWQLQLGGCRNDESKEGKEFSSSLTGRLRSLLRAPVEKEP